MSDKTIMLGSTPKSFASHPEEADMVAPLKAKDLGDGTHALMVALSDTDTATAKLTEISATLIRIEALLTAGIDVRIVT